MLRPVPMPGPTTGLHLPGRSRRNLCSCWGEGGSVGCWRLKSSSPGKRPTLHATASSRHLGHAILHFTTSLATGMSWKLGGTTFCLGFLLAVLLLRGTPTVRGVTREEEVTASSIFRSSRGRLHANGANRSLQGFSGLC